MRGLGLNFLRAEDGKLYHLSLMTHYFFKFVALFQFFLVFFISGCNSLFFQPSTEIYETPNQRGFSFEGDTFSTSDGEKISLWKIKPEKKAKGVVLHFHGNAENMSTHYLFVAWLSKQGFWVLTHDYRGFGSSSGLPQKEKIISDSRLFFDWVFNDPELKTLPKIIIAQSLGGALAIPAISDYSHPDFSGLVLDSVFDSYREIAREKLRNFVITWPFQWPLGFLVNDSYSPIDYIDKLKVPVLLVHAKDDPVVPIDCSERLFTRASGQKEFWRLSHGGHTAFFSSRFTEKRVALLRKFEEWIKTPL